MKALRVAFRAVALVVQVARAITHGLPSITGSWARSGWEVGGAHVPGSFRMLGIWGASFVGGLALDVTLQTRIDARWAVVAALAVILAGLAAGTAVYYRCSESFALDEIEPWAPSAPEAVWPALGDGYVLRPGAEGPDDDEHDPLRFEPGTGSDDAEAGFDMDTFDIEAALAAEDTTIRIGAIR